ncbi:MAG TPA: YeiH family protein [Gallionellaceae bacterium]|nr:YeiH family protein [Gallionellaceae bacterium]
MIRKTSNAIGGARQRLREPAWWLGVTLAGMLAFAALEAANLPAIEKLGLSALTLAILLGMVVGNTIFPRIATRTATGVDFSKNILLRTAIVLYGFRITFQQIAGVGLDGIVIDVVMVSLTLLLAVVLGRRLFGLDEQTSILIGAGSAICGAAAVMAAEPVVRGQAHKVSVAVATVVVFGSLGMFGYPLLYPYLHMSEHAYGVYVGSTVHEVAQVVAAGKSVSDTAASTAVIEKMLRVMMLAPFLLILSSYVRGEAQGTGKARITIPWFAVLFIAASAVNSLHVLPAALVSALLRIDNVLLAMAMAALGLRTHAGAIRQAGIKPLLLATLLFAFLTMGGYAINRLLG